MWKFGSRQEYKNQKKFNANDANNTPPTHQQKKNLQNQNKSTVFKYSNSLLEAKKLYSVITLLIHSLSPTVQSKNILHCNYYYY